MYMWVATFRLTRSLWWIFLTLWIAFYLLGFGALLGLPALSLAGGWVGLLCGGLAMYTSFALVTNGVFGRDVLPVGVEPMFASSDAAMPAGRARPITP